MLFRFRAQKHPCSVRRCLCVGGAYRCSGPVLSHYNIQYLPTLASGSAMGGSSFSHPYKLQPAKKMLGNEFMSRALGHLQHHFPSLLLRQCLCVRPLSHSSHMEARAHISTPSHIDDVGYWSPFRRPPKAAAIFVKRVPPRRRRLLSRWDLFGIYFSHLINPRDLFH